MYVPMFSLIFVGVFIASFVVVLVFAQFDITSLRHKVDDYRRSTRFWRDRCERMTAEREAAKVIQFPQAHRVDGFDG